MGRGNYEEYKASRRRNFVDRAPPLITFNELYEHALSLEQQRGSKITSKIYFDANDEYVREEQVPELLHSSRSSHNFEDSYDEMESHQRTLETISRKYSIINVFLGNEDHMMMGTTRITRNIFAGTQDRKENAKVFLDNVNKIKLAKEKYPLGKDAAIYRNRLDGQDRDGLMS